MAIKKSTLVFALLFVASVVIIRFMFGSNQDNNTTDISVDSDSLEEIMEENNILGESEETSMPEPFLSEEDTPIVTLTTNFGDISIELFHNETPVAANNFAALARDGFYDGVTFHRVIKGFMIQGGDPKGDGTGGPGYTFEDEEITREYDRGIVAYANSGPNTNGSQFFIMHEDYPLPPNYVIFGQVVDGMEVVDQIAEVETKTNNFGEKSVPTEEVVIKETSLESN